MIGQQHIEATQTGLFMLASIKKWVNTYYGMLSDFGGTSKTLCKKVYAILLSLNASPAYKCQHEFHLFIS